MVTKGITQDVTEPSASDLSDFDPYSDSVNSLSSHPAAVYWWNVFSPLWNAWSGASDLVLALMTVERYLVMRRIDQLDTSRKLRKRSVGDGGVDTSARKQAWLARAKMVACVAFSLLAHLPYCFQFNVENCGLALGTEYNSRRIIRAMERITFLLQFKQTPKSLIVTSLSRPTSPRR